MADMMYRNKFMKDKTFWTIQEVIKTGERRLELFKSEVESICDGIGITRLDEAFIRYNGKLYYITFVLNDWGYDSIIICEKQVIDITD